MELRTFEECLEGFCHKIHRLPNCSNAQKVVDELKEETNNNHAMSTEDDHWRRNIIK